MLTGGSANSYHHNPSVGQFHDTGDPASDEGPATPGDDDDDEDDKDKVCLNIHKIKQSKINE